MAFNEALAECIRQALVRKKAVEEKKMFGGIGFLLHGNLLVGVWEGRGGGRQVMPLAAVTPISLLTRLTASRWRWDRLA